MDNIVALTLFEKNGGNQESVNDYTVKRDLGNINFRTDHDYCGVPTKLTQQSGGLGISSQSGLTHVSHNLCLKLGTPILDLFASKMSYQIARYATWKPDPYSITTDWFTKENTTRPNTHSNINNTLLTNTVLISTSVENANKKTNSNTKFNQTFNRSKRKYQSISVEQNSYASATAGFRKGLSLPEVTEETTQLIVKSRRQSSLGNYELAWKKWSGSCDSWKVDPFRCPVNYVFEYLSSLFYHVKLLYRTIGLHS